MEPAVFMLVGLLGFAGFSILLVAAWLMMRDERAKKAKGAAPAAPASEPARPAKIAPGAAQPEAPPSAHEVLRVLRDNLTGRLVVDIGGMRYARPEDIRDDAVRQGLMTTLQDLSAFAGAQPAADAQVRASQAASHSPPRVASTSRPAGPAPIQPPSMNPFKQMQVLRELNKAAPAAILTIAEQIDEILQPMVEGTRLARRGLRVSNGPTGTAVFQVDGKSYEAVGDVPDPEVQAQIRAAIAEWESRQ